MTTTIKQNLVKWQCNERQAMDKWRVVEWARRTVERTDVVYLDTETTGLHRAFLVEIAVLSRHGSAMINTLVKPPVPSESGAEKVHGISKEMLEDAPTFPEIYPRIKEILSDRHVVIYNSEFDTAILDNCCDYYLLPRLKFTTSCAMHKYAAYFGDYSEYWGNYKWQKLPGGGHRAATDTRACYELVRRMTVAPSCPVNIERMFPPVQLFCEWKRVAKIDVFFDKNPQTGYYARRREFDLRLPHFCLRRTRPLDPLTLLPPPEIDISDIPW